MRERPRTPCSNQFTMLKKSLESSVRDLGAGTQLLPAEYVAACFELGHAE